MCVRARSTGSRTVRTWEYRSARSSRGQAIPWHYHTAITDTTYCIEGTVQIELLSPPERVLLDTGQSHAVATNRPHRITAHGDRRCRFLLVQGVGKYDRHPVDPETWKA